MIIYKEEIDSTNLEAARLADSLPHGTVIAADAQTAGRGRRGRSWVSRKGENLYFSLLLKPEFCPELAPMLTLVMALAVTQGIEQVYGCKPRIKWPNDIVVNGRKVCGILTEMQLEAGRIKCVIVGVGINVNQMTFEETGLDYASSLQKETGMRKERKELLETVVDRFEALYREFCESGSLQFMKEAYEVRLANMGLEVRVLDPKGEYTGTALGINDRGELLVCREDGSQEAVYAGEVSVRGLYGYV
jgi:BirA family biotin operon repressor/biotin-[acetyl-CoA-carboxylase] ligase